MSQVNEEDLQGTKVTPEDEEALFDQGFSIGDDTNSDDVTDQQDGSEENEAADAKEPVKADEGKQHEEQTEQPAPAAARLQPQHQQFEQPQGNEIAKPEPPKLIEVPEHLADELAALKKLNPAAADLALEDSPEGERIRNRMEEYGAEMALDRAEAVLDKRGRENAALKADLERQQQAVTEHNTRFFSTLKREHPDYAAMITDPARRDEAVKKQNEIMSWISAKPYAEAAPLMQIATSGRDPNEICALLTQFESEHKVKPTADPTGALAVPGRGAPTAPAGIGDKDDFDAGWDLNPSK